MSVKVKICGITTYEDAVHAAASRADLLGFNFYRKSPRYLAPSKARELCDALRAQLGAACPTLVGVFVNELVSTMSETAELVGLDFVQLHGDESEAMLRELRGMGFKAVQPLNAAQALDDVGYFAPTMPDDERAPSLLVDAYHPSLRGGTGAQVSAEIVQAMQGAVPRLMLAGGLTPENIAERVRALRPWGVDVASGVEGATPGVKDPERVRDFIVSAKAVE